MLAWYDARRLSGCTALAVLGACRNTVAPDGTLDAVLARGAPSVVGPIDSVLVGHMSNTTGLLLPRDGAPRLACGTVIGVGPTTPIYRRTGARASLSELRVGMTISSWADGFTLPFCRPSGYAHAIVIEP
jgi:hypothetical protein